MIVLKNVLYFLFVSTTLSTNYLNQASEKAYKYATVSNDTGTMFTLEYIVRSPYHGRVKWKITNHSTTPVYNVSISDKAYKLKDGQTVSRSGESIISILNPGESKTSIWDAVNSDENKWKGYNQSNTNEIQSVSVDLPIVKFSLDKNGSSLGWETAGKVKVVN